MSSTTVYLFRPHALTSSTTVYLFRPHALTSSTTVYLFRPHALTSSTNSLTNAVLPLTQPLVPSSTESKSDRQVSESAFCSSYERVNICFCCRVSHLTNKHTAASSILLSLHVPIKGETNCTFLSLAFRRSVHDTQIDTDIDFLFCALDKSLWDTRVDNGLTQGMATQSTGLTLALLVYARQFSAWLLCDAIHQPLVWGTFSSLPKSSNCLGIFTCAAIRHTERSDMLTVLLRRTGSSVQSFSARLQGCIAMGPNRTRDPV